ncbi:MAG: hypothetical protein Q9214_003710 [Letrouitia sp. 1 TL-2023]
MKFLPGGWNGLQLDIVGFLAILGEASVLTNAQVSSLSKWFLIPRLLPAPQALIRTSRPERLEPSAGKVLGAHSGGIGDHVNYIAHLIHDGSSLRPYSVRCEKITKNPSKIKDPPALVQSSYTGMMNGSHTEHHHHEKSTTTTTTAPTPTTSPPKVQARSRSWLTFLSILGSAMSAALLALSIHRDDGFALLATLLLSSLSTLIGFSNRWRLRLQQRTSSRAVPRSDIVIKYPNGSFLVVRCEEDVARELYWHPEECEYVVAARTYRIISLLGTLVLMFGVICLGNAQLELQVGFAASYIILNAAYWVVAALPAQWHWDLSYYEVRRMKVEGGENNENFTSALWTAIAITGTTKWVTIGNIAPVSSEWKNWMREAEQRVTPGGAEEIGESIKLPEWDCNLALTNYFNPQANGEDLV